MRIEIEHVTKIMDQNPVLNDICLSMEGGKVYGLKGVNGSGKTMLMRLICGLIYSDEGSVTVDGKVLGKEIDFPESLGLLIENPAFADYYTGQANLSVIAGIRKEIGKKEIEDVMVRVGLDPYNKKKYRKYSLGMKQRLGIAAAIMEKSELLVLDEPANALDKKGVEMLKTIIREEKERGALIVLSCHEEGILHELSDVLIEIENGAIESVTEI